MTGPTGHAPRAWWFGDRAVMVAAPDPRAHAALVHGLTQALPGRLVRRGMETVLVESAQPEPALLDGVLSIIDSAMPYEQAGGHPAREIGISVAYTGPDLVTVAHALRRTVAEVIEAHRAQRWRVAMMGFAPGFGYLVPDGPETLDWSALARRDTPRTRVPRGSVAVAAGMSAVYPSQMPGGWHLVGTTDDTLFDPSDDVSPSVMAAGDLVRFAEAQT
jgi:KipI family sensor histidine kinase inhibitor